jgi:hypothetical protein
MTRTIDLSGTRFDEPCAQVGRDRSPARSRQEALAYRAALVAVLGVAANYALRLSATPRFRDLLYRRLRCPSDAAHHDDAMRPWPKTVLHWLDAMMPAPYDYAPDGTWTAICPHSPSREAIERALITSRPAADGTFALDLFGARACNLRAGYPDHASRARTCGSPASMNSRCHRACLQHP